MEVAEHDGFPVLRRELHERALDDVVQLAELHLLLDDPPRAHPRRLLRQRVLAQPLALAEPVPERVHVVR